jgi:hypothetical protein
MRRGLLLALLVPLVPASSVRAQTSRLLDGFDRVGQWTAYASAGVSIALTSDRRALRAAIDYHGGAGYAVIHRPLDLTLPDNYVFRFKIRGTLPSNTVEFKLLDGSGDNVWWAQRRNFPFDTAWTEIEIPRREIAFAWGPAGGGVLHHVAALEVAITAGKGGKGTVWFDSLSFGERPSVDTTTPIRPARIAALPSSRDAARAMVADSTTAWPVPAGVAAELTFDLGHLRGFGAARVVWGNRAPLHYSLAVSDDGRRWRAIYQITGSDGDRDYLFTGPRETRWVRLRIEPDAGGESLRELTLLPLSVGGDSNRVVEQMARDAAPGLFPRSFTGSLGFWTVVGADGDTREALVEESGRVEVKAAGFSLEPFLRVGSALVSWHDVSLHDSLADGRLPIPIVTWSDAPAKLETSVWTLGGPDSSTLLVRYRVTNGQDSTIAAQLLLAVRPLQVNPPSQLLNIRGGLGRLSRLALQGDTLLADSERVVLLDSPEAGGVSAFDQGDVSRYLAEGRVPALRAVTDPRELASGLLKYSMALAPGESRTIALAVPWHAGSRLPTHPDSSWLAASQARAAADWRQKTAGFVLDGPPPVKTLEQTVRASVGYILVNRDAAAIQPGSRAYARSWIRDAALTSSALLRLGVVQPVHEFLQWFAPYQFASGKVPCCVDRRGADPVTENDSQGEFIYLAAEYTRRTGDTALLRELWPRIRLAASYMDSLRHIRMTGVWVDSLDGAFLGLMPESISHEGYSAHPEHSYWDDFWAARGFADAARAAATLGQADSAHWRAVADSFRHDLLASISKAMVAHQLDFVPGSVELGDFDATSTTIAGDPVELLDSLPAAAVNRTFEMFDSVLTERRSGNPWTAYTPYEARVIGTKVRLGWRASALRQVDDLLADQRPSGWRQWPEVIRRDSRAPEFLGDLPHTWVASDFVRSVLDLFVYEAPDHARVLMAGVAREWLRGDGIHVRVPWSSSGAVDYEAHMEGDTLVVAVKSAPRTAPALYLQPPLSGVLSAAAVGRALPVTSRGVQLAGAPAEVRITARPRSP